MNITKFIYYLSFIVLIFSVGCSASGESETGGHAGSAAAAQAAITLVPPKGSLESPTVNLPATNPPLSTAQPATTMQVPTQTITEITETPTPVETEPIFEVGQELTLQYLRDLQITGSEITFEQELDTTAGYTRHLVSYISEGNKIYGLLTIPRVEPPDGGFKAIIFNHGYIPPVNYRTTEGYTAYVDYLAKNGFVVFKIDYRGHGQSQGEPNGTYFSPGYTIDAITALKSLQRMDFIDPQGIGMWGHSMAGNLVLRAMLVEPDVKAGVVWAGAVYSYDDFEKFRIDDNTYRPPVNQDGTPRRRRSQEIFDTYGRPNSQVDYWRAVSLTENINLLESPLQLHHAQDDPVVNIGYSNELAAVLQQNNKDYEFFNYEGGGHNIVSPYFEQAMQRTVEFFQNNL